MRSCSSMNILPIQPRKSRPIWTMGFSTRRIIWCPFTPSVNFVMSTFSTMTNSRPIWTRPMKNAFFAPRRNFDGLFIKIILSWKNIFPSLILFARKSSASRLPSLPSGLRGSWKFITKMSIRPFLTKMKFSKNLKKSIMKERISQDNYCRNEKKSQRLSARKIRRKNSKIISIWSLCSVIMKSEPWTKKLKFWKIWMILKNSKKKFLLMTLLSNCLLGHPWCLWINFKKLLRKFSKIKNWKNRKIFSKFAKNLLLENPQISNISCIYSKRILDRNYT